ncbi:hypothetical protein [Enhygromyxa salina]|uniref:Uncharacterized protein n=1 Tax=Enhygromyxa salina TaxID=215803 RepID=A0A2S9YSH3_9BACT|nr:hypothetical protein [Enhygromyxa salina]PRQ08020.1 hypothetical protein ENSA7_23040 [Enhygromyxa salina]
MSETAARVDLRQANLSESAQLRELGDRMFLALEQPPPVRSLLKLTIGDEQKAFEVGRVIEVVGEGEPARGCYGQFVEFERLGEQAKVGSEHLQPGISGSGVPAPVVIMSTAEMMLGEAGSEEHEAAAASEADTSETDDSSGEVEASSSESDAAGSDSSESESDDASSDDDHASDEDN